MTEAPEAQTNWSKIPTKLQHQFFIQAEKEAKHLKNRLTEQKELLKELRKDLNFRGIPERDDWKHWRIACVDGSFSPNLSERLGARYGVYAAGYMIFEGADLVEEDYRSNRLSRIQTGRPEDTEILLGLLTTKMEREAARFCLERKNVDYVLIDGAYYGFRVRATYLPQKAPVPGFATLRDLIDYIRETTTTLKNSRKTVGIVKRIRTEAIDGWLKKNHRRKIRLNDKAILASLMPSHRWFAYRDLFASDEAFHLYSYYAHGTHSFEEAAKQIAKRVQDSLRCLPDVVLNVPRYYLRCTSTTAPFCFETPPGMDIEPLIAYFQANHNPATGLPFPLDLIDSNVGLPASFTKEFVEEVEALLIRDHDLDDMDLANHFQPLNPQKED